MFKLPLFSSGFKKSRNVKAKKILDKSFNVKKTSSVSIKKIAKKKNTSIDKSPVLNTEGYKSLVGQSLKRPIITEKATIARDLNKYVFEVKDQISKNEIAKAINSLYKVKVIKVNVLKNAGKKKRRGRIIGWQPGERKAIVTLKLGDKIDFGI